MSSKWKSVPLNALLTLERRKASIDTGATYKLVTLPLHGKGARLRKLVLGSEVGSAKFAVRTGDLMISKIDARKGSNSLLPASLDGAVVTGDSLSYSVDTALVLPSYLDLVIRTPAFAELCGTVSGGTTNRVRLDPDRFLALGIDLPPLDEQQRIVDLIGSLDEAVEAAESVSLAAGRARRVTLMNRVRRGWDEVTLGDISNRTIGRTPPRKAAEYWTSDPTQRPFLTIADMKSRKIQGGREGVTELAEAEGKAKRVPAGSLLLSFKLSLGRVGITEEDVFTNEAIAWIRPKEEIDRDFLALALDSLDWSDVGSPAVKGKTLNAESLDALPIPLPPLAEQRLIVDLIGSLDVAVEAAATNLSSLCALRSELLSALLSGAHAIPESYDQQMLTTAA